MKGQPKAKAKSKGTSSPAEKRGRGRPRKSDKHLGTPVKKSPKKPSPKKKPQKVVRKPAAKKGDDPRMNKAVEGLKELLGAMKCGKSFVAGFEPPEKGFCKKFLV